MHTCLSQEVLNVCMGNQNANSYLHVLLHARNKLALYLKKKKKMLSNYAN